MDSKNNSDEEWFDLDQIKEYMKLPALKKLEWIEGNARFLFEVTPKKK